MVEFVPGSPNSNIMVTKTQKSDPAYFLLERGHVSVPTVYSEDCYICNDPEFAQMGLPLCRACK